MKKKIEKAMKELKIEKKIVYTAEELYAISKKARVSMFETMFYLRYGK